MILGQDETLMAMAFVAFALLALVMKVVLGRRGLNAWLLFIIGIMMYGGSTFINCGTPAATCGWDWGNLGTWIGWFTCNIGATAGAIQLGQACVFFKIGLLLLTFVAFAMGLWRLFK